MFSSVLKIDLGVITSFAGGLGNIPPGWFLCNGTNGTPDLQDKFVPAAGPILAVGNEGGSVTHNHDFTGDGHTHGLPAGSGMEPGVDIGGPTQTGNLTGTTDTGVTVPPFFALAYIQYAGDS